MQTCKAIGCLQVVTRPAVFCFWHWHILPDRLRREGWEWFKNSNEENPLVLRDGHEDWLRRCILAVRNSEEMLERVDPAIVTACPFFYRNPRPGSAGEQLGRP